MIQQALHSFGLSGKEIQVYLAALELGEARVSEIAKKSRIERTHCYSILGKLTSLGLVNESSKGARKQFATEPPDKLESVQKRRLESITQILPELKSIYNLAPHKPKVRFYEGRDEFIELHEEILNSNIDELLFCGSLDELNAILMKKWSDEYFIPTRIKNNIRTRMLTFDTGANREYRRLDSQCLRQTRFLKNNYYFGSTFYVYGDTVAIFSGKEEIICLVTESKEVTTMFTQIFEIMWASAQ